MKFNIITLGCKVNAYESEAMKELLLKENFVYTDEISESDIIIVNTCSVTNMADSKSKKIIRRIRRENPNCILIVGGCSTQNNQDIYNELGIDILLGNRKKSEIGNLIKKYLTNKEKYQYFTNERNLSFEEFNVEKFTSQTRAYIKIQDGCNNFCSYCIIPYVRGNIRSKNFDSVIKEAQTLVNNGHYEIVLTGIHTGSYKSGDKDLSDLIIELAKIEDLKRIRLSSIEITELDDKFMTLLRNENKLCSHLHIPLQSGSDEILKRMNRKYDTDYYHNKIERIRSIRPDISITTDVIVGHPYETEKNFNECTEFCKKIGFSKIHVFPYSVRNGTSAAKMPNQVNEVDKKDRAKRLLLLSEELECYYYNKFLNQETEILTEVVSDDFSNGHTDNYLNVIVDKKLDPNTFNKVKIISIKDNQALGKLIK